MRSHVGTPKWVRNGDIERSTRRQREKQRKSASLYNIEGEELQTNKKKRRGRNFLGKCYSVTTVLQVLSPFLPWLACLTAVWVVHMHYLITYSFLTTCYPFLLSFFVSSTRNESETQHICHFLAYFVYTQKQQ